MDNVVITFFPGYNASLYHRERVLRQRCHRISTFDVQRFFIVAKDNGLAGIFFWMAEQDNGYNLNAVNHVLGNSLLNYRSDATPQHQIPVCGANLTPQEM